MRVYKTAEIAAVIGIHPNTVRLYEEWELIPKARRLPNGYRVFTDFHVEQCKLARLAFQIEVTQNGLRKKIVQMVKVSAKMDFDAALVLTQAYLAQLQQERTNAEEAAALVKQILSGGAGENTRLLKRKEVSQLLGISGDTLRNWEMNGLLRIKRKENGYRVYTDGDIRRLKVIRSLRCANYSLEAILHLLCQLSFNPDVDILGALNTPREDTDILAVCDKLVLSLTSAMDNAQKLLIMLNDMKTKYL